MKRVHFSSGRGATPIEMSHSDHFVYGSDTQKPAESAFLVSGIGF